MMLDTIKKIRQTKCLILPLFLVILSCKNDNSVQIDAYKNGRKTEFSGMFYTTEYGGLNYYIPNDEQRKILFNLSNIDSLMFKNGEVIYSCLPLLRKSFSRERNNSDFSFFINPDTHKIVPDTVGNLETILIFAEKTDLEKLKEEKKINFTVLDNNTNR